MKQEIRGSWFISYLSWRRLAYIFELVFSFTNQKTFIKGSEKLYTNLKTTLNIFILNDTSTTYVAVNNSLIDLEHLPPQGKIFNIDKLYGNFSSWFPVLAPLFLSSGLE